MRFTMTAAVAGLVAAGVIASSVASADNVIQQRRALMKQIGEQAELGAAMLKGQAPFDAAKAATIFKTFQDNAKGYAGLFPPGSGTGDTKATAAVWSDSAGFAAALAKFEQAVAENAPKATTADGFKVAFVAAGETCRSCHQTFKSR